MSEPRYNLDLMVDLRLRGQTWGQIGATVGASAGAARKWYEYHGGRELEKERQTDAPDPEPETSETETRIVEIPSQGFHKIHTLEELVDFLEVDRDQWKVSSFDGNAWEQHSVEKGKVTLLQVKAKFERDWERQYERLAEALEEMIEDAANHAPPYEPIERTLYDGDPVSYWAHIYDPHLGMLAWGREVGADYDLSIALEDYGDAADHLVGLANLYPVEEFNFVVGHDLVHVDHPSMDGRGNARGGATSSGTAQDIDTRLSKMFTAARRAVVRAVDRARLVAPVKVRVVPGNHDRLTMYKLGETLHAWYRNDPEVEVIYGPAKRFFCQYGENAFMLTHGEEYNRKRDNLPLIFATECPPEIWSNTRYREILTGHNHIKKGGRYVPTADGDETRTIRTRSLPGLTPEDAWHYEQGYKHWRASTAIAYRKSGGIAGLHEFTPTRRN